MPRITVSEHDVSLAKREQVKASIGIDGLSGDGKSGLMLEIAHKLEPDWQKIHATDTENRSLLLYEGLKLQSGDTVKPFHHAKMSKETGYSPFNYEFFRNDAIKRGCTVGLMDSATHMWYREGGVLSTVNRLNAANKKLNKFNAWGEPDVSEGKNLIFDLIRDDKIHVISTIRIKDAYVMEQGDKGMTVKNVGMKQMQQEGLQYEFDLLMRMISPADTETNIPAKVEILKSRYEIFRKGHEYDMTPKLIDALVEYLEKGTSRDELNEKLRLDLAEGLKERALADQMLKTILKNKYPKTKLQDMDLSTLREINSMFLELES